ncbi:MAG: hypothetical protein PPFGHCPK_01477 (plasmid) [Spiroplasma endosymbiont of Drosophila atripex]|nr:MAG: hypothetical protein PPFGHCPK_01477 [Spiroplasma endosymbiont of Drosophila atripex]
MFDNIKSTYSFTVKSISWLTVQQIPALTFHQIKSFTPQQVQALTPEQIQAFTPQQRLWLEIKNNNNNDMSKENKTWKYWLYVGITTTISLIIIAGRKLKSNFQKNINDEEALLIDNVKPIIELDKNNSSNNEFDIKNEINSMHLQPLNKPLSKENCFSF